MASAKDASPRRRQARKPVYGEAFGAWFMANVRREVAAGRLRATETIDERGEGRMLRQYPDAREQRPPPNVAIAIEGIEALLCGGPSDLSDVTLDMTGIHAFNQRVYELTRAIPRGETRTYGEVATRLGASGAAHSVAQAIARNPFMIIVPCHRVLEAGSYADRISPNGGVISRRWLLSIEGSVSPSSKTLFDVLLPVAPSLPQG